MGKDWKEDPEAMPSDPGMPLPLRVLAGVGALAFLSLAANLVVVGIQSLINPPRTLPPPGQPAAPRLPSA
jgi:hypothetical protein